MIRGNNDTRTSRGVACFTAAIVLALVVGLFPKPGVAQSVSERDLQILTRAAVFLHPELPPTATVAIAFEPDSMASRRDAEAIAATFGAERHSGHLTLRPAIVPTDALALAPFSIVIVAADANSPKVQAAARNAHALCVTGELTAVREGLCAMTIQSGPRVEILLNHEAAADAGIGFAAAFRMMIREF